MVTQGFSLLGHLIVILIIGITFSVALPGLGEFRSRNTAIAHSQSFQHLLKYTRSLAIMAQKPVSLCSSEDGSTCTRRIFAKQFIVFRDSNKNYQRDEEEKIIRLLDLREGAWHYRWKAFRRKPAITFFANGLTYDNGTFNLCSGKYLQAKLVLSRSGRTRKVKDKNLITQTCPRT